MKMVVGAAAATNWKKAGSASPSRFQVGEQLGKLQFFLVDSHKRWPMQGWSSGDETSYDLDEEFVAEECSRLFTLNHEGRWPLQGWCKMTFKSTCDGCVAVSAMGSVQRRWPQGW